MVDVTKVENVAVEVTLEANLLRSIIKMDFLLELQQPPGKGIFLRYTMNIFGSKSGHLSNRIIERFFFIFFKLFAVFDDFSKWRVPNVLQNSEK